MTASEFAFLSFGLVLGVVGGAGIVEIFRTRPAASREIRLTVTPNSVPARRAATLAEDAFVLPGPTPAGGGPGDRRRADREHATSPDRRTTVRSLLPPAGAGDPASGLPLSRIVATRPTLGFTEAGAADREGVTRPPAAGAGQATAVAEGRGAEPVGIPIHLEPDPQLEALRVLATSVEVAPAREPALRGATGARRRPERLTTLTAVSSGAAPVKPDGHRRPAESGGEREAAGGARDEDRPLAALGDTGATTAPVGTSPATGGAAGCAEARRVADERCAVAALAREQAAAAQEAVRSAQRAYGEHMNRAETAAAASEPGGIRAAKERAQHAFRDARAVAGTAEELERVARQWLTEINRINREARDATNALIQEREAAHGLVTTIERLTVEAETARLAAEAAESTCAEARQAVAECEAAAARQPEPVTPWPAQSVSFGDGSGGPIEEETELGAAFTAVGPAEPAILRLLRGDRGTLGRLVAQLAGEDLVERRRWQLALAGLVDAVVARAIESAYFQFPESHPFWGPNSQQENRDIAAALSSLGYRFDGLGGWADDRIPSQRDLSLAVGYAGLDPMRTRRWPSESELQELFREVTVAADEYLASAAGELTLGELISVLGRRADGLADVWNAWGRVRPLLLSGG